MTRRRPGRWTRTRWSSAPLTRTLGHRRLCGRRPFLLRPCAMSTRTPCFFFFCSAPPRGLPPSPWCSFVACFFFFFLGVFPFLPLGCLFGATAPGSPAHFLAACSLGALMGVFLRITLPRIGLLVSLGLRPDPLGLVCVGWLALARGAVAGKWAPGGVHPPRPFPVPIAVLSWGEQE